MRIREGSKVEVLNKKDVPWGSWRGAEIICGNGHAYTVRYDGYSGRDDETLLERVSRKALRPYPPMTEVVENWVLGDLVEVFDDFSWKMATVTRILDKKHILVRLLGSSLEFKVGKFDIRPRQLWQDDRWIVIGKGSGSCGDRKHDERTLKFDQMSRIHIKGTSMGIRADAQADCFPLSSVEKFQDSDVVSHRTLKRQAYGNLQIEACNGCGQKFRAIDKEGELYQALAVNQFSSPEKVDATAFPGEIVGEKITHSSFDNRTGFSEMDAERRKLASAVGCSSAMDLDSLDPDSVTSSVGSCSITNSSPSNLYCHTGSIKDIDVLRSDAESFNEWAYEEGNTVLPIKEDLATEIHRLELHAYRRTMGALYASGPLSWEQEALMTNVRFFLHISNDEHLMEGQNRRLVHLTSDC